jgi:hypothetical protein
MGSSRYLLRRGLRYSFRLRVPEELQPFFDERREILRALGTACYSTAKELSRLELGRAERVGQVAGSRSTVSGGETHAFLTSPSGPAAARNSAGGDAGASAGGCGLVDGGRRAPFNASSAMGLLAPLLPLLPSLLRAWKRRHARSSAASRRGMREY